MHNIVLGILILNIINITCYFTFTGTWKKQPNEYLLKIPESL